VIEFAKNLHFMYLRSQPPDPETTRFVVDGQVLIKYAYLYVLPEITFVNVSKSS
jgi:hypothetical protein